MNNPIEEIKEMKDKVEATIERVEALGRALVGFGMVVERLSTELADIKCRHPEA